MKVRFNGGVKDVPLSEVTAENYLVPQGEERHWHVIQEKKEFDRNTGKRLSRPVLQKYDTKCFPQTRKYLMDAGYTITVLHDPIEYAKKVPTVKSQTRVNTAKHSVSVAEHEALKAQFAELKAQMEELKKPKRNPKK